jgi:DNA-directed RNA polymerase specialized sigma24 family protein
MCSEFADTGARPCVHEAPQDLTSLLSKDVAEVGGLPFPYCVDCWKQPRIAELLAARFYLEPTIADPCSYGFCDLISQIVRQRAWARDSFARDAKESDLRFRLIEKKSVIEAEMAGKEKTFVENYIRRVLKNRLTNDQARGEGRIIANSTVSLSDDCSRTDRKALSRMAARNVLTELTGGEAGQDDDRSLDQQETLVAPEVEYHENGRGKNKPSEAKQLFDTFQAEALSQIATLTGRRTDGFDTHLDLEKALSKLPDDQQEVFAAIYLENGELLNRPRTYNEATYLTGLTTQQVRTLERKATAALRPVLAPSLLQASGRSLRSCTRCIDSSYLGPLILSRQAKDPSPNDRSHHLALSHRRKTRRRGDGCGL